MEFISWNAKPLGIWHKRKNIMELEAYGIMLALYTYEKFLNVTEKILDAERSSMSKKLKITQRPFRLGKILLFSCVPFVRLINPSQKKCVHEYGVVSLGRISWPICSSGIPYETLHQGFVLGTSSKVLLLSTSCTKTFEELVQNSRSF